MTAPGPSPSLGAALSHLRRWLYLSIMAAGVYVILGCLIYPSWWYPFLWQGGFRKAQHYGAIFDEVRRIPIAASAVLVLLGLVLVWLYVHRARVRKLIDAHGALLAALTVLGMAVAALAVNATQRQMWQVMTLARRANALGKQFVGMIDDDTRVSLEPPVSYYYLDRLAVDSLFSQVEPAFVEKARVETETRKRGAKVGLESGPLSATAEASVDGEAKREFAAASSSPERRALELVKFCLDTGRAAVISDHVHLSATLAFPKLRRQLDRLDDALADPLDRSFDADLEEGSKRVEQVMKDADLEAAATLSSPPEYVLLFSTLTVSTEGPLDREYLALLKRKDQGAPPLSVRFVLPSTVSVPVGVPPTAPSVRVFGHVERRPSDKEPTLLIRPIAVF